MVTALLVGLVVGFVLAIPPGPIALACLHQALAGQARQGVALVLGASAMDIGYALLAFQGGCIVVLVVLGVRSCRSITPGDAARAQPEAWGRPRDNASPYLRGVLIALTNLASSTFLPSLIFTMSLLHIRGWVGDAVGDHIMYALGFGGGGALWFLL
jgi:threonine/homoserine/homoserine lactone efflux protein